MNGLEEIRNPVSCTFNKTTGVKKYEYTETQVNAIEKELEEKAEQDVIINVIKEVIEFGLYDTKVEETEEGLSIFQQIGIKARREITKKEKELYRWFILNQCFPKELKALESVKELFDFDFAIRFPTNQPMLRIMNKRTNEYWEIPIPKEKHDLLKEVLL